MRVAILGVVLAARTAGSPVRDWTLDVDGGARGIAVELPSARLTELAAALHHPNIVPVIDVGISDGVLFLVMPIVDGGSLEKQRVRFGDLKLGNVLLASGVAQIADCGLAATRPSLDPNAETMSAAGLTSSRALFGTP